MKHSRTYTTSLELDDASSRLIVAGTGKVGSQLCDRNLDLDTGVERSKVVAWNIWDLMTTMRKSATENAVDWVGVVEDAWKMGWGWYGEKKDGSDLAPYAWGKRGALLLGGSVMLASAVSPNAFEDGGTTQVSALMMFLGNENSVYILDKAEANAAQVNGHPAWGAVWDIHERTSVVQDIRTNTFCASGMHLPNGSFVTFGGYDAVGPAQAHGSQKNSDGQTGAWDAQYQDFDGRKAIRIVKLCTIVDDLNTGDCAWFDDPTQLAMKKFRWYSAVEPTGDGEVVIIGGFVTGGYVNRWLPNTDPAFENGMAEPMFEFFPARVGEPQIFDFLVQTSGLNAYAHTYLMPSGRMFLQANLSTTLWDFNTNKETPLPPMPKGVIRVYPASGATAMLPLTPANNYEPTMIFCGGSDMEDEMWGDYLQPRFDTWTYPASKDCQRITPEPQDGSFPVYIQDDDIPDVGRTMGQFIALPTGKYLLINGAEFGTAGFAGPNGTSNTPLDQMPFGASFAAGPVLKPALYDPTAPLGKRWSQDNLTASTIPRVYHSTAVLLPDGSVLIAGSNPNLDVNLSTTFPTEYRAEVYFPYYFSAPIRPSPQNVPKTLSYGGDYFNITIRGSSYTGAANSAAGSATVVLIRGGFSTHAMQMGQRFLQLNNTYTVNADSSITLHVAQLPPNPNLFQPGPALLFVNIHDVPSNGTFIIVGNGRIGKQPIYAASTLPDSKCLDNIHGGTDGNAGTTSSSASSGNGTQDMTTSKSLRRVNYVLLLGWMPKFRRHTEAASTSSSQASPSTPVHTPAFHSMMQQLRTLRTISVDGYANFPTLEMLKLDVRLIQAFVELGMGPPWGLVSSSDDIAHESSEESEDDGEDNQNVYGVVFWWIVLMNSAV
ncbi:hypothetical protein CVT24_012476 [Panaeolus cyanescens]|uniref:Galactose oxidase-like Early set domain-containing protein n=1 Tax=Panaeolus cyanescens TaxID=181874 RepID=A0A409WUF1_9AGAR|nr:hypothetical protein CVT24_012476 [Panaeolus cyanescens]